MSDDLSKVLERLDAVEEALAMRAVASPFQPVGTRLEMIEARLLVIDDQLMGLGMPGSGGG